ncbi:hypothetical protein B0H12DRAFT_1132053 [Mycena haematopus]|nr:hypothetical protein B0H12DRAFT_1132053 [Mycena haematopus]
MTLTLFSLGLVSVRLALFLPLWTAFSAHLPARKTAFSPYGGTQPAPAARQMHRPLPQHEAECGSHTWQAT